MTDAEDAIGWYEDELEKLRAALKAVYEEDPPMAEDVWRTVCRCIDKPFPGVRS